MQVLRYSPRSLGRVCRTAAEVLSRGGLIVYPTDTVYGIGADATNKKAVAKVYRLKKRPKDMPLSVMVSDIKMLRRYAYMREGFKKGKYTFILKPKRKLPVSSGNIGFRIPAHWCTNIAKEFGKPITTTSANLHGKRTPKTIRGLQKVFGKRIALYIDGGTLSAKPSKVIDLTKKKRIR